MRALALVVLALASPAAAAEPPSRVIDSSSVGAYRITQSRARAIDVFGAPTISADVRTPDNPRCRTYWRSLELRIEYLGECSFTGRAWRVTVDGAGWRTRQGLRIGDPVKHITRVYRGAKTTSGPSARTVVKWGLMPLGVEWDLRRARPRSSVIVATQSGRVVGFELRRL